MQNRFMVCPGQDYLLIDQSDDRLFDSTQFKTSRVKKPFPALQRSLPLVAGILVLLAINGCGAVPQVESEVDSTANPQVALYSVYTAQTASVTVAFGQTTGYGMNTWTRSTPQGGGRVSIFVAGMRANTTYHMRASIQFDDGTTVQDSDHEFHTGSYPANSFSPVSASTAPGQTPQPGVELLNEQVRPAQIMAADLQGNVIWAYLSAGTGAATWFAPKLLPDGDFVALASDDASLALKESPPASDADLVREFDLAGDTVKEITMTQLNSELAAAGYNLKLLFFSHDVAVLPNGHWIVIANTMEEVVLDGQSAPTPVIGDVLVDLNTDMQPVWVWNEFDHLELNRHPWNFPDWTHTNAVIYSPSDGDLLVSMRHQNWVVKVDYENGAGSGNILWRLGEGGDFKLIGGTDPTDWQYAQHGINFASQYTSGLFNLTLMDNGDDRMYPGQAAAVTCGTGGSPACYSTVPIYQIDESGKTATLVFHQIVPPSLYNEWGGNAEVLANGDVEYDLCGIANNDSQIVEVTDQPDPQTVWTLTMPDSAAYRGYRLPSLYPGVQW